MSRTSRGGLVRHGGRDADVRWPRDNQKYANRRLYNTATSSYVTLDTLCQMVKDNIDFVVDAKTGEDITRSVLTQIIVEEVEGPEPPADRFLRLIGFYGDNLQMVVPRYLDYAMNAFSQNQDRTRVTCRGTGRPLPAWSL